MEASLAEDGRWERQVREADEWNEQWIVGQVETNEDKKTEPKAPEVAKADGSEGGSKQSAAEDENAENA